MDKNTVKLRSQLNKNIRSFFESRGFLEVETPILSPDLIPETAIDFFSAAYRSPGKKPREFYLVPSPEIWMKKLLSRGSGSIFQICRCFRNSEQLGRFHNPEFTMLEWYEDCADYRDSMETTRALLAGLEGPGADPSWKRDFRVMTMEEAFREFLGEEILPWCLPGKEGLALLTEAARRHGHSLPEAVGPSGAASSVMGDGSAADADVAGGTADPWANPWEELFNLLFVHHVEPRLPADRPLFLTDYPDRIPTLAKKSPQGPWYQRWELYIAGMEIANCYTEETDPAGVNQFFLREKARQEALYRSRGETPPAVDPEYRRFFHQDFPACSGVALGLDRLLMVLAKTSSLGGVIFFPFFDIL